MVQWLSEQPEFIEDYQTMGVSASADGPNPSAGQRLWSGPFIKWNPLWSYLMLFERFNAGKSVTRLPRKLEDVKIIMCRIYIPSSAVV